MVGLDETGCAGFEDTQEDHAENEESIDCKSLTAKTEREAENGRL